MTSVRQALNVVGQVASINQIAHQRNAPFPLLLRAFVGAPPVFPENEVEVSREYIVVQQGPKPSNTIEWVIFALANIIEAGIQNEVENQQAIKRNNNRKRLRDFLLLAQPSWALDHLHAAYTALGAHSFDLARTEVDLVPAPIAVGEISVADLEDAISPGELTYVHWVPNPPHPPFKIQRTLKGYGGPVLKPRELFALREMVTGGSEYQFRINLLKAEIHFVKQEFGAAIGFYQGLLSSTVDVSRRRFLAIRAGAAFVSLGDSIFRSVRNSTNGLPEAVQAYDAAILVINNNGVSQTNPLARQIVAHATQQKAKIENGFNYLGYSDGFVPLETVEFLRERTNDHITLAKEAGQAFEAYLTKAFALADAEAELNKELQIAKKGLDIANLRVANAADQVTDVNVALADLADKQKFLEFEQIKFGYESAIAAALAVGGEGGSAAGVSGFVSQLISFKARGSELKHQTERAKIQRSVAERTKTISQLESDIARFRHDFIDEQLRKTQGRNLNKELYYRLANFCSQLTEKHVEIAIRLLFLFERAVAFKYHKPGLSLLQNFNFTKDTENILLGGIKLEDLVISIEDEMKPPEELDDDIELDLSLRARYPLEFSIFQQTGRMQFAISLYDLDKKLPGTSDRRITAFAVKPVGLTATATGYTGNLTHAGTFLERDRTSTLDPTTNRLMPTDEEIATAFASLQGGKILGTPIRGVIPFQLDSDTKLISAATENLPPAGSAAAATVRLFERYGAATLWTLDNFTDLDPRRLTDIRFKLRLESLATNIELREKVKQLTKAYEVELAQNQSLDTALDHLRAISMGQLFADEFLELESGESSFTLRELHFPFGQTDLKLKAVIAQAIDFNGDGAEGVQLKISKPGTPWLLERTTGANGFSEDVTGDISVLPQSQRFPVLGTWRVELPDPAQFHQVFQNSQTLKKGDLLLFFVYEFKEI